MKLWLNICIALACVVAMPFALAQDDLEVENLRVPLEHYPDGTVKTEVTADKAKMKPGGALVATGLKVEFRETDGKVHTTLLASKCEFDRVNKAAKSDTRVELLKEGLTIKGTGFEWASADQRIKIKNNVEVRFEKDLLGFDFSMLR